MKSNNLTEIQKYPKRYYRRNKTRLQKWRKKYNKKNKEKLSNFLLVD